MFPSHDLKGDIEAQNKEIARRKAERAKREAERRANRNVFQKGIEDYVIPAVEKTARDVEIAMTDWYEDSVVKDVVDWTGEKVEQAGENIKSFFVDLGEDIGKFYNRVVITPLGIYLTLDIKEASVSQITNPVQAKGERGYIVADTEIDLSYRFKKAGQPAKKSNVSKVNATLKMNYDLDLKTKEIKVSGLSIPKISSEWLNVSIPTLGEVPISLLKTRIRKKSGKIYLDIKLAAEPDKSEGDDWWEWYDKMQNKIKDYTYTVDITSEIRKSLAGVVKGIKPINLKELGLKNLPV